MTIILWVLSFAVAVGVGVFMGFLWGRANAHKHYARVIVDDRNPVPRVTVIQRVFAIVIALIAVLLVVQNSVNAERDKDQAAENRAIAEAQQQCNADLYTAINARSEATQRDQQAFLALIETLISQPPDAPDTQSRAALQQYRDTIIASNESRKENPYPEPRCGT
jgi:hypothetical protein